MTYSIKQCVKKFIPPIIVGKLKSLNGWLSQRLYLWRGRIPWTHGYHIYKRNLINLTLAFKSLLACFRSGESLPPGYGIGIDERCVEYPWLISHLQDITETLLDAGSTLNHDFILGHPILQRMVIHILTLAPEKKCFWFKGISYLYQDLRDTPYRDTYFDSIACLSTLEHIGFDNTLYTCDNAPKEIRPRDSLTVMRELNRILKPGGTLYLTVPFGAYRNYGTFQQFDRKLLSLAIEAFGNSDEISETFYRYTVDGWNIASADECGDCEYAEWINLPRDQRSSSMFIESDYAASARAVGCVRIVKSRLDNLDTGNCW